LKELSEHDPDERVREAAGKAVTALSPT
jgi:hypothetical protein